MLLEEIVEEWCRKNQPQSPVTVKIPRDVDYRMREIEKEMLAYAVVQAEKRMPLESENQMRLALYRKMNPLTRTPTRVHTAFGTFSVKVIDSWDTNGIEITEGE